MLFKFSPYLTLLLFLLPQAPVAKSRHKKKNKSGKKYNVPYLKAIASTTVAGIVVGFIFWPVEKYGGQKQTSGLQTKKQKKRERLKKFDIEQIIELETEKNKKEETPKHFDIKQILNLEPKEETKEEVINIEQIIELETEKNKKEGTPKHFDIKQILNLEPEEETKEEVINIKQMTEPQTEENIKKETSKELGIKQIISLETKEETKKDIDNTQVTWKDYFKNFSNVGKALEYLRAKITDQKELALQKDSTNQAFFSYLVRENKKALALNVVATLENKNVLKQLTRKFPNAKKNHFIKILECRMDYQNHFFETTKSGYFRWSEYEMPCLARMLVALHKAKRIDLTKKRDEFKMTYRESLENSLKDTTYEDEIDFFNRAIDLVNRALKKN